MVNLIEKPTLLEDVIRNHSALSFGFIIFLVLGCFMAIYIAYYYYKPIYQLAQYMKQSSDEESEKDEFEFIRSKYDNLNEVKESLSREIENQWPMVEERLVTKLLFGTAEDKNESDIVESILEKQMRQQEHVVVLIAAKKKGTVDFSKLYREKENVIKEGLESEYCVYTSNLYYFEAIAVIVSKQEITESDIKNVSRRLAEMFRSEQYLMSFGKIYEGTSGVHISYLEAITNLKYKLLNPNSERQLESTEDNEKYSSVIIRYQTECLLSINHCLECENEEEIAHGIEEMLLNLEELPGQIALMCCYDVVAHLMRELKKDEIHLKEEELYRLTSFGTVEEFGACLKAVLVRIRQAKAEARMEIQNDLVNQILIYIEENYQDCNLCLVGMAEYFGYSSSYLSKFITQNLRVSFSELVSKKRLDYTKECLVRTDKPIAQIAQEAGYANLSNFTRRFKHAENMTPGQYRSLYKNSKDHGE